MINNTHEEHDTGPPISRKILANLRYDLPASIVVFLVAVPLSLGVALAAGAPLVAGLISAVVGSIVASLFGGSALQVSGPSAGVTVVLAQTITTFGWRATCAITVAAGLLQILFGLARIARAALAISPAIVHGLFAGIGVIVMLDQLHIVLGGKAHGNTIDNVLALPAQLIGHHDEAVLIGVVTIATLLAWPHLPAFVRRVPGPLAAITIATVLASTAKMNVSRIDVPADLLSLHFMPQLPTSGLFPAAFAALTIALIASLESLLSAVAIDKRRPGPRTDLNRELIGQGMANVASGSLGGFPVTGVVVRSMTNVEAGARTRMSALLHSGWILLFVLPLAGLLRDIPLAALAGLLVYVGAKLVNPAEFREVVRHGDLAVYLVTLAGAVGVNLLTGVALGIALSLAMMLRRTIWSGVHVERDGGQWRVVIEGALTFLSVPRLTKVLATIPPDAPVTLELLVDYLDHAAFDCLFSWQAARDGVVTVDEIGHPWFERGRSGTPIVRGDLVGKAVPRWLAPWSEWQADHGVPEQRTGPHSTKALCRGAAEFQRRAAPVLRDEFGKLAHGQHPHTLFLTCGDSRIVPNLITTSGPGDLFTVRNIGNLVPTEGSDSVGAAIEYGVGVLHVREIVVCGHSSCGAMKALLGGAPGGMLGNWLRHGAASLRRRATHGPLLLDGRRPDTEGDQLALHNVVQQLEHLRAHPVVAEAEARGELHLTGMYFDVGAAQVFLFDRGAEAFVPAQAVTTTA
ncbi:carbonic anhydrase [Amycolatopsis xylanica]|uniref:Carbonic anhydrase n=1 Tax=Amycolatopsis xylanica TaxID=589385 RepID=A0A1H3QEY4_9PSEU|nr:bifunctional SulP family inorganic anion transporter/carbonic anhydrase [Amycolatopsis xylanica]SDZ11279.1 carbonic anhydrase [Amycolatopsis xylanica]